MGIHFSFEFQLLPQIASKMVIAHLLCNFNDLTVIFATLCVCTVSLCANGFSQQDFSKKTVDNFVDKYALCAVFLMFMGRSAIFAALLDNLPLAPIVHLRDPLIGL